MLRIAMLAALVSCCAMLSGCCSGPCGPCGGGFCGGGIPVGHGCADGCNGCGPGWNHRPMPGSPLACWHQMKKNWVCGWGCGETYYGEWRSHPPDCVDPCHFDYTYHGGGCGGCGDCSSCCDPCLFSPPPRCRPILLGLFGRFYGDRYCEGCDDYCGGYYGGGEYYGGGCGSGNCGADCGCSTQGSMPGAMPGAMSGSQMMAEGNVRSSAGMPQNPIREANQMTRQPMRGRLR